VIPPGVCPLHGVAWKLVPAGVSKTTGKAYGEFWACSFPGCRERPAKALLISSHTLPMPTPPQAQPGASTASERTLLLLGCLDFASRVFQGTSDMMGSRQLALELYEAWKEYL
jgi:hypothetical protein